MGKITIIGLGPGDYDSLTLKVENIIKNAQTLILRTEKHPMVDKIAAMGIRFSTCDDIYDSSQTFEEVYETICDRIINIALEGKDVVYGVPGHPLAAEKSVGLILEKSKGKIDVIVEGAMSFIDAVTASLKIDISSGLKIIDGLRLDKQRPDVNCGNIITQVYSKLVSSEVKLILMDHYKDDQRICIIKAAGVKNQERMEWIPLYQLDSIEWVDYLTSIYIPPAAEDKKFKSMDDLVDLMEYLRGDEGCPWDRKQNHNSLKPYLLEECYEAIDAIESDDIDQLIEELGDVLLQVVFHCQIGKEAGEFHINDVITFLVDKLISRHPHVFGETLANDEGGALESWEASKRDEKGVNTFTETLIAIPKAMSSLTRSYKIQERAALAGFDWPDVDGAMAKVDEEILELKEVYKSVKKGKIEEEIGDLLFAVVNVARFLNIQPELALVKTINKFINRFNFVEENALKEGKKLEEMTLEEMDLLWNKAKTHNFTKNDKN
ncbi:MAG: nucleoside triphosphate pyrophosphohydrolase [Lutispora sp.]|nr:nucleoside triphosphate pyrophosphohydrolase [Lutispora sp.]MDD4833464.1 nucleoside triphosphate pyrophosphohydrolase [Lutispora sp.]